MENIVLPETSLIFFCLVENGQPTEYKRVPEAGTYLLTHKRLGDEHASRFGGEIFADWVLFEDSTGQTYGMPETVFKERFTLDSAELHRPNCKKVAA